MNAVDALWIIDNRRPGDDNEVISRLEELYAENLETARRKNADYANEADPFANFRSSEKFGVPVHKGMMVRMGDKMERIANLLNRPAAVADESVLDTLSDLANYAMLLRIWLEKNPPDAA